MGRNYFTEEQICELKQSQYVENVSKANVHFTLECKQKFYGLLLEGFGPSNAFIKLGINPKVLGENRVMSMSRRMKNHAKRTEGFHRKKSEHIGRPKKLTFESPEEEIKYLKDQLEYKNQEIEFLKKLEALEKKYR